MSACSDIWKPPNDFPVSSFFQIQNSMLDVECSMFICLAALKQFRALRKSRLIKERHPRTILNAGMAPLAGNS